MNTVITNLRVKQYATVLQDMLTVMEAQTQGRVRRPRRQVVDLLNTLTEVCLMLHCQTAGGPQLRHHEIASIKQKAHRLLTPMGIAHEEVAPKKF